MAFLPWVKKLFYKRVKVTQRLPCIPPGVALNKTPDTSKWKFSIGYLISSILNPSSLMLTEFQKSPTSFNSFEKSVSLWSKPSSRRQLGTLETSPLFFPNRLSTSGHTLCDPRIARLMRRKSERTKTPQKTSNSFGAFMFIIRSTEFASKKEGNARELQTSS